MPLYSLTLDLSKLEPAANGIMISCMRSALHCDHQKSYKTQGNYFSSQFMLTSYKYYALDTRMNHLPQNNSPQSFKNMVERDCVTVIWLDTQE